MKDLEFIKRHYNEDEFNIIEGLGKYSIFYKKDKEDKKEYLFFEIDFTIRSFIIGPEKETPVWCNFITNKDIAFMQKWIKRKCWQI